MAFTFEVQIGKRRYQRAAKGFEVLADKLGKNVNDFSPVIRKELLVLIATIVAAMEKRHSVPWRPYQKLPAGARRGLLARRTGRLIGSLRGAVVGTGVDTVALLFGNEKLKIHETGVSIRPKRRKYLAIPLPGALDRRGVPKRPSPRDWPNTFVMKSRRNPRNLVIMQKEGGHLIPLYLLTKSTRLPRRLGLVYTAMTAAPVFLDRLFDKLMREMRKDV